MGDSGLEDVGEEKGVFPVQQRDTAGKRMWKRADVAKLKGMLVNDGVCDGMPPFAASPRNGNPFGPLFVCCSCLGRCLSPVRHHDCQ